jgi:hypothetical protein
MAAIPPVGSMHSVLVELVVVVVTEVTLDVPGGDVPGGTVSTGVSFTTAEHPALRRAKTRGRR